MLSAKRGLNPLVDCAEFRRLHLRHDDARRLRRLLEAARWQLVALLQQTADIPDDAHHRLVRLLHLAAPSATTLVSASSRNRRCVCSSVPGCTAKHAVERWRCRVRTRLRRLRTSTTALHLRWFDHFLKGRNNGVDREPPVQIFVMGTGDGHKDPNGRMYHGGYWRTVSSWPLPGHEVHRVLPPRRRCPQATAAAADAPPTVYTYDPRASRADHRWLVFEHDGIGRFLARSISGSDPSPGPRHRGARIASRRTCRCAPAPDVIVFQTEPLAEDVEVIGPIVVKLFASSTAVDTDFTAKLVDVYPPSKDYPLGFEMNLTDGIMRARYRNSPEKPEFMKPGEVYEFRSSRSQPPTCSRRATGFASTSRAATSRGSTSTRTPASLSAWVAVSSSQTTRFSTPPAAPRTWCFQSCRMRRPRRVRDTDSR